MARYKWKPSASQRRAFADNMKDPQYAADYAARKETRAANKRATSKFDYNTAGGQYVPTKEQHDYCLFHWPVHAISAEQQEARNMVMTGYNTQEKVHHDHIHIVNELRRSNFSL